MDVIWRTFFYFYSIGLSQLPYGPSLGSESWVMIIHLHRADEEGVRCLYNIFLNTEIYVNGGIAFHILYYICTHGGMNNCFQILYCINSMGDGGMNIC